MSYEDTTPAADKWLMADGSVTTMAGEVILPADPDRAKEYESRTPGVAKWLLPDGSIIEKLPVSGVGAATSGSAAPEPSDGKIGDFYITFDGIYTKKLVESTAGFMLECGNDNFNGCWTDIGVNETTSGSGGEPQGSHYYKHESGQYFLCWNTAYGGYWWINTQLSYDNGSATAYRSAREYTEIPPSDLWNGEFSGTVTWTKLQSEAEPHPEWVKCFDFHTKNGSPYHKYSRLMKYSEGIVNVQGNSGISLSTYVDGTTGINTLNAYLNLGGAGNMARIDGGSLFVGESYYCTYSPTGATQALSISGYRNFKVNLSAAAITFSFSGAIPTGNYPCTLKVWLIPKSTVSGTPKHTVTWPASVKWVCEKDHRLIGATGQADTPVLCELTTFDNGTTWIGRAFNVLHPDKEV